MNINELPDEILVRILSFLPLSDRLESALTCRRWAQTIAPTPSLLRDVWFVIRWNQLEEAEAVFASSNRRYENLRLCSNVYLREFNAAFWASVGPDLRKLELIQCNHSLEGFFSILQACSSLETLKIRNFALIWFMGEWSELAPGMNLESIRNSMRNLRHLHLDSCVDANTLERLFILMPNVTSIAMSQFEGGSDFLIRLPKILGASRKITMLELDSSLVPSNYNRQLVRTSSATLRTLKCKLSDIISNTSVAPDVYELRNCSMLRNLALSWDEPRDIRLLLKILRNFPELESLEMSRRSITSHESSQAKLRREDLMPIFDLRKLRELFLNLDLHFESECSHVPDGILGDISRMVSLESLSIGQGLGTVDSTRFRILASMPNLRELAIAVNAESIRIVLSDLGRLRTLEIWGYGPTENMPVSRDQYFELEQNISIPEDPQGEQRFSSLETLACYFIPFTDALLGRITAHHGRLRIVTLGYECKDFTDAGLVTLFQHEPLLEELTIIGPNNLDGTFLESLAGMCRRLRSLSVLSFYSKISHQAKQEFESRRPSVKCDIRRPF